MNMAPTWYLPNTGSYILALASTIVYAVISLSHLIHCGSPRKSRPATQHFSQNAPNRPHVDSFRVPRRPKQNLRGPIPTSRDIICQVWLRPSCLGDVSAQTEVAQLHVAIAIKKQIARLDISVQEIS